MVGVVDFFDRYTGYSQIVGQDQRMYRTHRRALVGVRELRTGERVEFTPAESVNGPRALAVRPLREEGS